MIIIWSETVLDLYRGEVQNLIPLFLLGEKQMNVDVFYELKIGWCQIYFEEVKSVIRYSAMFQRTLFLNSYLLEPLLFS